MALNEFYDVAGGGSKTELSFRVASAKNIFLKQKGG
jgi:hypothetical protein